MFINYEYSPFDIISSWLHGRRFDLDWPQFKDRSIIYTHRSRISILLAYRLLRLSPGDEVLIPSYNCGSEIDPLLFCGAKVVLYRVDSCAKIDFEDIRSRITSKTRALYVTHYFGWPQKLGEIAMWCRERNIFLIEDCALSLFSKGPEGPVGCMGDAAIHCFWKTLPVPDGGALALQHVNLEIDRTLRSPDFRAIFRKMHPFLMRWLRNTGEKYLGSFYSLLRKLYKSTNKEYAGRVPVQDALSFPDMPANYYFDEKIDDWAISRLSKGIIIKSNPKEIVQIRRRNYNQLYEAIQDLSGVQPVFDDLPEGVCPLVMPVLVSNPQLWKTALNTQNLYPIRWWNGYHRSLSWEGFPEASKLKNHLLAFHIDQYLDERHIEYVADNIRTVSCRYE